MTKFAKLARWIMATRGVEPEIEDMIGPYPVYGKKQEIEEPKEYEPNKNELYWIQWAQNNGYTVQRTDTGLKIIK